MIYRLGIDLGATNIAAGVVDEEYRIVGRAVLPAKAPRPAAALWEDTAEVCRRAAAHAGLSLSNIREAGLALPGCCDPNTGELVFANNLHLVHEPAGDALSQLLGLPVRVENDANAAALGELLAGAARGVQSALAVTLGTGVGGGIIIDGHIYSGAYFAGGEIGHVGMIYEGRPCNCGRRGCIETYCSATGLINTTKEEMLANPASCMWEMVEGDLSRVNGSIAFQAKARGDVAAGVAVERYIGHLAYALASCINILEPELLVVGGGVSGQGEILLAPVRALVAEQVYDRYSPRRTQIVAARLGNDAGIIGAAFLSAGAPTS